MGTLSIELLKKLGACSEARAAYRKRPVTDVAEAIKLLQDGCAEWSYIDQRTRLRWGNWLIVRLLPQADIVRYAVYAAEQVLRLFEDKYPHDKRPRIAIEAAKKWISGEVVGKDVRAAAYAADAAGDAAAYAAAYAADAAYAAADAAYAADAAGDAAAYAAAYAADAAYAAGDAAYAAGDAAADAAADAAYNAMLSRILDYGVMLIRGDDKAEDA